MLADAVERSLRNTAPKAARADAPKPILIRKVAVLGAGAMGSRIAAHLVNAGIPVVLLDIPGQGTAPRNAIVKQALDGLSKAKPAAFFDPASARLITSGNFEDDLQLISDCDWIIEAVTENLEIKRALLSRVDGLRRKEAIVSTNTSGLPVSQIAEEMPEEFRRNWLGTHFFNPPRYMRLLELIPTPDTSPAVVSCIEEFADRRLGKTVVHAKDTPNFIANRIGTFAMMNAVRVMQAMDLSVEQVDALTGRALGWPKTGTFRLADLVGLDVLGHVVRNFQLRVQDERNDLTVPGFMTEMLSRGWLGDKTGQGFYKKQKDAEGKSVILALNWRTLEYRPSEKPKFAAIEMAKNIDSLPERLRMLLDADPQKDTAAAFYWQILPELWNYAANRIGEVADSVDQIDSAMRTGFNWDLGPFELWDAVGVPETVGKMRSRGMPVSPAVENLLARGFTSWYRGNSTVPSSRLFFDIHTGRDLPVPLPDGVVTVDIAKKSNGVVSKNSGASLIDLGDGIACIEFHTKMNALGADIVSFITQTLKPGSQALADFDAFIISGDAQNFSVGANLMQLLLGIQEQEWDEINLMVKAFQKMTQAIKYSPKPVVAAPFGMCLGGGTEICMHATARQAHAELYAGLVEMGVGLIPAGGGCKEMTLRTVDAAAAVRNNAGVESVEMMQLLRQAFETIAMAKVSTSAAEARRLGYLTPSDGITMNRLRLIADAKAEARHRADQTYVAPVPRTDIPAPGENLLASLKMGVHMMRKAEYISDHDARLANRLAYILCGGNVTPGTPVSEQYLLDLEREAFLSLCGEKKTQERIAFMLKNGKPLRN